MANYTKTTIGKENRIELHEKLSLTGAEISLNELPAGANVPFVHYHKENEEIYIILSGHGTFQVDDEVFPIETGSIIRLATNCDRNLKNTSQQNMVYICIQARENSLKNYTMSDAEITERKSRL